MESPNAVGAERPVVSVVVATYNRAELLSRNLDSLLAQTLPQTEYEIIVVDNNSTDGTGELVKRIAAVNRCVKYVFEPEQGVSPARNRGCREARGTHVAFIDDDAFAAGDWLEMAVGCFRTVRPEPHAVGGPILGVYPEGRPRWFTDDLASYTWGERARFLDRDEAFYGSNMFVNREVFEQVHGFDHGLGPVGDSLFYGEEMLFFERLWAALGPEARFYYSPEVRTFHVIPASRTTVGYAMRYAFVAGQTNAKRSHGGDLGWKKRLGLLGEHLRPIPGQVLLALKKLRYTRSIRYWAAHDATRVVELLGSALWIAGVRPTIRRK
jgi:glycosyltransferase involved in cell wall biosynthesis